MTIKTEFVESKRYEEIGALEGDVDVIEEMLDQSGYLCDAISSVADSNCPIYNGEIWEGASAISDYIEEAIAQGLAPVESGNVDLMKIFQAGYYQYYSQLLYDNLDAVAFNVVAEKVNEFLSSYDKADEVDIAEVEGAIEEETENTDNNDTFDDLTDKANAIIEQIQEGNFSPTED